MKITSSLYFLDFDGVICDSIRECFVSSWMALFRFKNSSLPEAVSLAHRDRFYSSRPFIRIGEDYVLLHELILSGSPISSQEEFDRAREQKGKDLLDSYKRCLLDVREQAIRDERSWWMSLHSIYPGLVPLLQKAGRNDMFYILSTKKASLISEILQSFSIEWPVERILYSGSENKNLYILDRLEQHEAGTAVFIDDQKDHFSYITDHRIRCLLASWGYIKPEWLRENDREILDLSDFRILLEQALA